MVGDIVPRDVRSKMMRAVRQHGTGPEIEVRKVLRALGSSFRTCNRDLPGSPDIANRRRRWAIFVHGCFWHGHQNCAKTKGGMSGRIPASNRLFWEEKIRGNRIRDRRKCRELRNRGFRVLTIWECELRDVAKVKYKIGRFLAQAASR